MSNIILTDSNFNEEVEKASLPVLVDFWATWCAPCKMQGPIVEEIAEEFNGKAKVGKLDVDQNQQAAGKFGIMSIPTLAIFKNGKVVKTMIGVQSKNTLSEELNKVI
ncbi:MAG: thioredoxin [bacterium]|nr:thioredoxin [bacterium]